MSEYASIHSGPSQVTRLYRHVIDEVIHSVRESFLEEGVDESVLSELKQIWEAKLVQSRALEQPQPIPQQPHQIINHPSYGGIHRLQPSYIQPAPMPTLKSQPLSTSATAAFVANNQFSKYQTQHTSGIHTVYLQPQNLVITSNSQPLNASQQQTQVPSTVTPNIIQVDGSSDSLSISSNHSEILKNTVKNIPGQMDGAHDSSSDDEVDVEVKNSSDDDDDDDEDEKESSGVEEAPLNSDDDVSESDPREAFDTENVIVCQFDKITRSKNKWKFILKDGIMNLNGRDKVFHRGMGEGEW